MNRNQSRGKALLTASGASAVAGSTFVYCVATGSLQSALLIGVAAAFFSIIYLINRSYQNELKQTAEKKRDVENEKTELAEEHGNELKHYVSILERTSRELIQSREKYRHAAYHDELTGLPNRNYFLQLLRQELAASKNDPTHKFAVLFLDLNRFRTINDSLGHATGDRLLRHAAKRLTEMTAEGDLVGHFGSDEFAFILKARTEKEAVTEFAVEVTKRMAEAFRFKSKQVFTSVSVGIAFGNESYKFAEDILRDADMAMYHAKDNRKGPVIFDSAMHSKAVSLQEIETDLRYAVVCNEFELFYQPIVELNNNSLAGFEALVRWNHPRRGLIGPGEFMDYCERSGLIIPMTLQLLETACRQIVEWQKRSPEYRFLTISVNLSGRHFEQLDLADQIAKIIKETRVDPSCVKLEITETVVMENAETAIPMLQQIRDLGVRLSIDDFGTGYSSLSYLHRFPIDILKVDRSFVNMMDGEDNKSEIVDTIIALARALKLAVIAEGIETTNQLDKLRELGCDYGQGYLFSRPLPVAEIENLLDDPARWNNLTSAALPELDHEYSDLRLA